MPSHKLHARSRGGKPDPARTTTGPHPPVVRQPYRRASATGTAGPATGTAEPSTGTAGPPPGAGSAQAGSPVATRSSNLAPTLSTAVPAEGNWSMIWSSAYVFPGTSTFLTTQPAASAHALADRKSL